MRVLLLAAALLSISNVTLFLWPAAAARAPHVYAPRADINPHFIRLNKEIEQRFSPATQLAQDSGSNAVGGTAGSCYRIGPFMHTSNYELAQAVLLNAGVNFTTSSRAARQSTAYRVYLGPYETRALAIDQRAELRRQNVLDNFVRQQEDGSYIVSLGIYTTSETATNAVQLFSDRLSSVKMQQENLLLPSSQWLHFSVDRENRLTTQLMQMDWGEQSAKMGLHECATD